MHIVPSIMSIEKPAGGETWFYGLKYEVKYSSTEVIDVNISLLRESPAGNVLVGSILPAPYYTAATGSYSWTIPQVNVASQGHFSLSSSFLNYIY